MSPPRFVALHGHFYQPPRESPWLERIEVQDSAAPYRDWNARVTAECYAPNAAARLVDAQNRVLDIVDNFAAIAFDVGPTLMAWLETERPGLYAAILEADRVSRATRGHGNAIGQAYGHAILPLCNRRDKITQVRWGLADFRRRFGREAAGLWLPETAVDRETLEVLVEEGVRFTLLAPEQAARVRGPGGEWRPGAVALDPRRAYRYQSGSGRGLALFFYDGALSHAIAFEGLLRSGDAMATRLLAGFDLEPEQIAPAIESTLERVLGGIKDGTAAAAVADALALLGLGTTLETPLDLWAAQNAVARRWRGASPAERDGLVPLMKALGFAPDALRAPRASG